jgi:uncharacterized repeat protein (TIGR01451 family)
VTAAVGVLAARPAVVLLSIVGVAFAAYPQLTTSPQLQLEMERVVDEDEPAPGDEVEVTVTVRNVGQQTLPDLRFIDGVPPMLTVSDGTPRHGAFLRPGAATRFSYTVSATHGTHRFEPATAIARDVAGTFEVEITMTTEMAIECLPDVPEVPLRRQTHQFVGVIPTNEGGSGVEFHRTREYHPGDALARIDWQQYAKTRQLATVEYREERGAAVVLCIDAREPAYRAATKDDPHAVASARTAAEQLLDALADTTDTVGLAALSDREFCWLTAATGPEHLDRARQLLASHPALSTYPPNQPRPARWAEQLDELRSRLRSEMQVVLLSPLADEFAAEAALTLEAAGHAVTVISPNITNESTIGERLARTERRNHIHSLRESGVRLVDWNPDKPLGSTLVGAQARWSQ